MAIKPRVKCRRQNEKEVKPRVAVKLFAKFSCGTPAQQPQLFMLLLSLTFSLTFAAAGGGCLLQEEHHSYAQGLEDYDAEDKSGEAMNIPFDLPLNAPTELWRCVR